MMKREYNDEFARAAHEAAVERELFANNPDERPATRATSERPTNENASAPKSDASKGDAPRKRASGPGSRYVEVPAEAIFAKLSAMGFEQGVFGGEIVFKLTHKKCKHVTLTVYTSLPARGGDARACGEDAIRVTAVFQRQTPGRDRPFTRVMYKGKRVHRTGTVEGVIQRMYDRAREAYAAVNAELKDPAKTCFECCPQPRRSP